MRARLILVMLCASLSACVGMRPMQAQRNDAGWPLLAPATLGATRTANQILRVAHGEQEATLNCVLDADGEHVNIVGMTALGVRAFTIKFDGVAVNAEAQPGVPQSLSPERLLNDVQLVYWPLAALKKALANSSYEISEPTLGTRRLKRNGKLAAEVHYAQGADQAWQGRAWLANLEFDYTLTIDSKLLAGGAP